MRESILNFFKGLFIGFANVIPGISGGTIAVITGIFDGILDSASKLMRGSSDDKKKAMLFLLPILIGVAIGIFLFSNVITFLMKNYEEQTFLFFMGLIFGTVPFLWRKMNRDSDVKLIHYLFLFLMILMFYAMSFLNVSKFDPSNVIKHLSLKNASVIFSMGFIAIAAMIIPGISGSFLLLLFGFYPTFLSAAKNLNLPILAVFFLGGLFSLIFMVNILNYFIKRFHTLSYALIVGLVIGSTIFIYPQNSPGTEGFVSWLCFTIGFILATIFSKGKTGNLLYFSPVKIIFILCSFALSFAVLFFSKGVSDVNYFLKEYRNNNKFLIAAHRGGAIEEPEESLLAFENASNLGKDVLLEMDVRRTLDGELVLFHDEDLSRLLGIDKKIKDMTFAELSELNLAKNFQKSNGEMPYKDGMVQIVTLRSFLERFNEYPAIIELKDYNEDEVEPFYNLLKEFNRIDRTIASCEDHYITLKMREKGLKTSASRKEVKEFFILNSLFLSSFYSPKFDYMIIPDSEDHIPVMNPNFIKQNIKKNIFIIVYTINEKEKMQRYMNYGIDGILTDNPTLLKEVLSSKADLKNKEISKK